MSALLSPEKALIFRITHVNNVRWILENGLHCASSGQSDPNYVAIGNAEIIDRRATRIVPIAPGGTLADYVPFYFTPFSPMLLNIKAGKLGVVQRPMSEIAILVSSLPKVKELGIPFVFTERHAALEAAEFYDSLDRLDRIDWPRLQNRDFKRDPERSREIRALSSRSSCASARTNCRNLGYYLPEAGGANKNRKHLWYP